MVCEGQGCLMKKTIEERFWEKVGPHDDPNVCWLWIASSGPRGGKDKLRYGHFKVDGRVMMAHRFSYEMHYHVVIPKGMTIDHVKARGCISTLCVNPYHLEVVTIRVNVLRGDGFSAKYAKATYCKQGHPYNEENTGVRPAGGRYCKACKRIAVEEGSMKTIKKEVEKSEKCSNIPVLPGVKTFPEVAQMLGISPQAVNQMYHRGVFHSVFRVGTAVLVLRNKEVEKLIASRQAR